MLWSAQLAWPGRVSIVFASKPGSWASWIRPGVSKVLALLVMAHVSSGVAWTRCLDCCLGETACEARRAPLIFALSRRPKSCSFPGRPLLVKGGGLALMRGPLRPCGVDYGLRTRRRLRAARP